MTSSAVATGRTQRGGGGKREGGGRGREGEGGRGEREIEREV